MLKLSPLTYRFSLQHSLFDYSIFSFCCMQGLNALQIFAKQLHSISSRQTGGRKSMTSPGEFMNRREFVKLLGPGLYLLFSVEDFLWDSYLAALPAAIPMILMHTFE